MNIMDKEKNQCHNTIKGNAVVLRFNFPIEKKGG